MRENRQRGERASGSTNTSGTGAVMRKTFEELQIKDDFMFGVIMRNPKFCKPFLERVLGVKIARIAYPRTQETIDITADAKSVRLDVYVENENQTVYNIEMQASAHRNLPKRSRYYQGMIDLNILEKGADYRELKRSFVIFVDFTRELDEAVKSARKNEKWRLDYMTLQMHYQEKYEEGMEEGIEQGINQGMEREKRQSALRMLKAGKLSTQEIAEYSELAPEQVKELEKELSLL